MKRILPAALAFALLSSGSVTVFAQQADNVSVVKEKRQHHFRHMKNFEAEVHKANELKIKRLEIKKEIVQKKDQLFSLHIKAAESGTEKTRSEKKVIWQNMKQIHKDLRTLRKEAHQTKRAMHEAMRADDERLAKEKMSQWININEKINQKLSEKSQKLDEMIKQYN
ncbi:hypothetical protein [Fictibacillus phosphorivorans]|uniref:hypothetical protein n=1 Tax=Fictibacillus phosphorivorans TaxID=1221500 RepID=UPI00203E44A7|nr:hypothetical protein [Fictibacillus phosphorivorans]MCM3720085.1 hypothetical protein [Fictibacillus phosphorivorans]MCM3777775.1 hypothetical protein [Fictibacillus phosphorivorans]